MPELFAYLTGLLLAAGVYLVLQQDLVRVLFGIVLIGNALNLGILAMGRSASTAPPIVPAGATSLAGAVANPLPQALVLTALVISFGLTAFALGLTARLHTLWGRVDAAVLEDTADAVTVLEKAADAAAGDGTSKARGEVSDGAAGEEPRPTTAAAASNSPPRGSSPSRPGTSAGAGTAGEAA
jgi:multicomponent Na+:H+ antiporter subunit C